MSILYLGDHETRDKAQPSEEMMFSAESLLATDTLNAGKKVIYVSQDNLYFEKMSKLQDTTLYCDSATSCIVVMVIGTVSGQDYILMSHLSRPGRFDFFFAYVNRFFKSCPMKIYAAGANPPEPCKKADGSLDYTARRNALQLFKWVNGLAAEKEIIIQLSIHLGEGNPAIYSNNLDCYGMNCSTLQASNERFYLTEEERDPTGGFQTLFCMFEDPDRLRNQKSFFVDYEKNKLIERAKAKNFQRAATMSDTEILKTYSSTPDFEVPWFCSTIRNAAKLVL